mgnify:FL=1
MKELDKIIKEAEMYDKIWDSLKEHLVHLESDLIIKDIKYLINGLEEGLNIKVTNDVKMGMALHICFMIDSLLAGEKTRIFDELDSFRKLYLNEMLIVKEQFRFINENYKINIGDNEVAYIVRLFMENNISV